MDIDAPQKFISVQDATTYSNQCMAEIQQTSHQMLNNYLRFFEINQPSFLKSKQAALVKTLNGQIQYIKRQEQPSFIIKPMKKTKNSSLIEFDVVLRNFIFKKISIIHVNSDSPNHILSENCNGNYSNVYCCHYRGNSIAFKCFSKPTTVNDKYDEIYSKFLKSIIREYCILKLCSAFEIGPHLYKNILGYDIAVYNDCVQFAMQYCPQAPQHFQASSFKADLMHNLLTLHCLQIIHHDIKFDNTRYSRKFSKYVFIDFGLSRLIKQPLGFKTYTCFRGSLNFVSEEMMQLFQQSISKKIDLYYNDLFALKSMLKQGREQDDEFENRQLIIPENVQVRRGFDKSHQLNLTKAKLFNGQDVTYQDLVDNFNEGELEQILNFISSLNYSTMQKNLSQKLFAAMKGNFLSVLPNYVQKYRYKKDQQTEGTNIDEYFYLMNRQESIEYYIIGYPRKMVEMVNRLQDKQSIDKMDQIVYFTLLSKLLEIESQTPKLIQLDKICQIAQNVNTKPLSQSLLSRNLYQHQSHLQKVTIYLLYTSLDLLTNRKWLDIFTRILLRAFITKSIDYFTIIEIYKILLAYKITFIQKAKVLLKFHQSLVWLYNLQGEYKKFDEMKRSIINYSNQYTYSLDHQFQVQQRKIINLIIGTQKNSNLQQNMELISQSNKSWSYDGQFCLELKLWVLYQQMSLFSYRGFLFETILGIQSELSICNGDIFRYYHFLYLLYYIHSRQFTHIEYLLSKFFPIFQFIPKTKFSFPYLIKCSYDLRFSQYTKIEDYLEKIKQITLQQNPTMNNLIQSELDRIIYQNYTNFIGCSIQYKLILINLYLKVQNKKIFNLPQNTEMRIRMLFGYILKQSELKDQYSIIFKKNLNIDYSKFPFLSSNHIALLISGIRLDQNDPDIIYLRMLKISLYMSLFIFRKKFKYVYQLCELLFKLIKVYKKSKIKMIDYLQFILRYAFDTNRAKQHPKFNYLQNLFLQQSYNILKQQNKQQIYFQAFILLIQILTKFYDRQDVNTISRLFSSVSLKLKELNNLFNTQRYKNTVELLYIKNQKNPAFTKCNIALIDMLSLKDNPYNIIICAGLLLHVYPKYFTYNKFIELFWAIHLCNRFIKQIYLQKLYIFFQERYRNSMPPRKLRQIKRLILINNAPGIFKLEQKQVVFLLVKPTSAKKSVKVKAIGMKIDVLIKIIGDNQEKHMSVIRFRSCKIKMP